MAPQVFLKKNGVLLFKIICISRAKNSTPLPKRSGVLTCKGRAPGTLITGIKITTSTAGFVYAGDYRAFSYPVWSGALALGGGLAFGCTERGPPPTPTVLVTVEMGGERVGKMM